MSNIPRLDHVVSFGVTAHHVLLCLVGFVHVGWVMFSACPTCMVVGNVAAVCPTVIIVVESFYVFGVYEFSGGEMAPPWSLFLSSAGVAVCVAWIPTVSVVASVPTVVVAFYLYSVATASIFLSASIVIFPVLVLALHLLLCLKRHLICWWRCAIGHSLAHHLCLLQLLLQLCVGSG